MSARRKRSAISLETKYEIIKLFEENKCVDEINQHLKSDYKSNTLMKIKRQKAKIISEFEGSLSSSVKNLGNQNTRQLI